MEGVLSNCFLKICEKGSKNQIRSFFLNEWLGGGFKICFKMFISIWVFPENGGTPISHPKMVMFSRKNPIVAGETHHFRKPPIIWGKWSKALGWLLQPPRPWCFAMSFWKLAWRSAKRPTMRLWRSWGSVKPLRCRHMFGGEQDDGPIFGGTGNDNLIVKEWFDESWLSFNVSWIWQSWQFFDPRWPPRWVSTYYLAWWPSGVSKSSAALLKTSGLWFLGKKTPTTLNEYMYI